MINPTVNPIINPMINFNTSTYCNVLACKTRCKCFFGIIDFFKKLIDCFDAPNLCNFNSIFSVSTISSFFTRFKSCSIFFF